MYVVLHENTQVTCMYMYLFTDISAITVASSLIKNCGNICVFKQTAKHCARLADVFTSSYITIHVYVCDYTYTFTPHIKENFSATNLMFSTVIHSCGMKLSAHLAVQHPATSRCCTAKCADNLLRHSQCLFPLIFYKF